VVCFSLGQLGPIISKNEGETNLSRPRLSHQRSQLSRDDVPRNVAQQLPLLSTPNRDRITQTLPREGVRHLLGGSHRLLSLHRIAPKLVDGVDGGNAGRGLHISTLALLNFPGPTLKGHDGPLLREFRPELGNDEVRRKERNAKRDGDPVILREKR
jgi:hypothetical protein